MPAINAALQAGSPVQLSAGVCLVSGSILPGSGSVLSGVGEGRTTLRATQGNAYPTIEIVRGVGNVRLSAFTVDGAATMPDTPPGPHSDGIMVRAGSGNVVIADLEVENAGSNGIRVGGSNVRINHVYVHDNYHNGIFVQGVAKPGRAPIFADNISITGSHVAHNSRGRPPGSKKITGLPAWDGIDIDETTSNVLVEGNLVEQNDILLHQHAPNPPITGHRVLNNTVQDSNQTGIDVGGVVTGFVIQGNTLLRNQTMCIVVGGAASGTVRGNNCHGGGPFVLRRGVAVSADSNVSN